MRNCYCNCPVRHQATCHSIPAVLFFFVQGNPIPDSSAGKESVCNAEDSGLSLGSGRSSGEGIGYSL